MSVKNKNIKKILWNTSSHYCPVCDCLMTNSGSPTADNFATLDHVVPKSLSGGNNVENLRLLCRKCNIKRGNKSNEEGVYCFRDFQNKTIPIILKGDLYD